MTRELFAFFLVFLLTIMVGVALGHLSIWFSLVYALKKAGFAVIIDDEPRMLPPRSIVKMRSDSLPRCGYREIKDNLWPMYAGIIVEHNVETGELTLWSTYTWPIRWFAELELWYWWRALAPSRKENSDKNIIYGAYHLRLGGITKKDRT